MQSYKSGHVYVLEFWATWCQPCIQAMPHISELAKKHEGKATFISVNAMEDLRATDESYFKKVETFVSQNATLFQTSVVIDGKGRSMLKDWLAASQPGGMVGIPASFVVGKDGKVAFIGSPGKDLDEAIEKALAAR